MLYYETIGQIDSRYTTAEAGEVRLYGTDNASGLTLGQLMIAVSCRQAAAIEARSVTLMNKISSGAYFMKDYSAAMEAVAKASFGPSGTMGINFIAQNGKMYEVCQFMVEECGVSAADFPFWKKTELVEPGKEDGPKTVIYGYESALSYEQLMLIAQSLKNLMEKASMTSQQDNIQLKSLVNSRDIAFKTATGAVNAMGNSQMNLANAI